MAVPTLLSRLPVWRTTPARRWKGASRRLWRRVRPAARSAGGQPATPVVIRAAFALFPRCRRGPSAARMLATKDSTHAASKEADHVTRTRTPPQAAWPRSPDPDLAQGRRSHQLRGRLRHRRVLQVAHRLPQDIRGRDQGCGRRPALVASLVVQVLVGNGHPAPPRVGVLDRGYRDDARTGP